MARSSNTDASVCIPRMLPWRDWDEWHKVKDLLFSPEPYPRCQGVQHVAVWRSRERIPHAVETTSQLVEARLNDAGPAEWGVACARRSEEELRLVYSTVVVRAVNGLTGHEQKTAHAAPVSSLAREIGLPTWLVDIRHEAAHKQLPGLVILRLAADFLMDYLWRRYWAPQAEHLDFLGSAFDQLICRYKSMSDADASRRGKHVADTSPSQPSTPTEGTTANQPTPATVPAFTTSSPPEANPASPISTSKKRRRPDHDSHTEPARTIDKVSTNQGVPSAGVTDMVARELACSVTPTALSWALVSLLTDGAVGAGKVVTAADAVSSSGSGRRKQGHLLPRSRDKYPTPGTAGVDDGRVAYRLTTRWSALLTIFHVRWRGFGAALLVRLVEALLTNASRDVVAAAPAPGAADRAPIEIASSVAAESSRDGDRQDHAKTSTAGNSVSKTGTEAGLERQALFIRLWVQHLLSRRWHLRGGDTTIKEILRKAAVEAGLPPEDYGRPEADWEQDRIAWADQTAELEVLRAAFFPLRELLGRCRSSLSSLTIAPASLAFDSGYGDAKTLSNVSGVGSGSHWATAGLEAVCHCLETVLGPDGNEGSLGDAQQHRVHQPSDHHGSLSSRSGDGGKPEATSGIWRKLRSAIPPTTEGQRATNVTAGTGKSDSKPSTVRAADDNDAAKPRTCNVLMGNGGVAGLVSDSDPLAGQMMNLDALERLLAVGGSTATSPFATSLETDPTNGQAADVRVSEAIEAGVVRHGAARDGHAKEVDFDVQSSGVACEARHDSSWELVESWTPCAIGTLPGWSAAQLHF